MLLEIKDLKKHYAVRSGLLKTQRGIVRAVDGANLSVGKGETVGLVGESGCGKSTLARLVLGLEAPTSGEVLLNGTPLDQWDRIEQRRTVQMIFQDPYSSLNPRWKIGSIVREPLDIHKLGSPTERRAKALDILRRVGLGKEDADRYPHEFSGGQRQRVAIARALPLEPDLIVCDEPVSALDVSIRAQVLNLLKELQQEFGLAYLFISHDLSVIGHLCDRVAVMYLGRIVELSDRASFFHGPLHPYAKALLSAVPVPDPAKQRSHALLKGEPPSSMQPPTGCPFHPRCPEVMDICRTTRPDFLEVESGRSTACWLYTPQKD